MSTDISTDKRINKLSDFGALLYSWIIPHCDDDGSFTADLEEIRLKVVPGRHKDLFEIKDAVDRMAASELISLAEGRMYFPLEAFYRYQNYIPAIKRKAAEEKRKSLNFKAAAFSPQNPASPSPSPSPSSDDHKNDQKPQPSAGPSKKKELDPRIKAWASKIYDVDRKKFDHLIRWVNAALRTYEPALIALALERFLPHAADVGSWWGYLDKLLDKEESRAGARRAEAAHERTKAQERDFLAGLVGQVGRKI